ncbi:hypothetical protein DL93DRAFT_2090464 [Clavulina sp. PMI_390]|nr:hypothetical protein DL93DRAFT_2090464 [Clavulina sp. PMI_390]
MSEDRSPMRFKKGLRSDFVATTTERSRPEVGSQRRTGGGNTKELAKMGHREKEESVNEDIHIAGDKGVGELTEGDRGEVLGRRIMGPDDASSSWSYPGAQQLSHGPHAGTTDSSHMWKKHGSSIEKVKSGCQNFLGALHAPSSVMMRRSSLDEWEVDMVNTMLSVRSRA